MTAGQHVYALANRRRIDIPRPHTLVGQPEGENGDSGDMVVPGTIIGRISTSRPPLRRQSARIGVGGDEIEHMLAECSVALLFRNTDDPSLSILSELAPYWPDDFNRDIESSHSLFDRLIHEVRRLGQIFTPPRTRVSRLHVLRDPGKREIGSTKIILDEIGFALRGYTVRYGETIKRRNTLSAWKPDSLI
jgi:hypothetical protein